MNQMPINRGNLLLLRSLRFLHLLGLAVDGANLVGSGICTPTHPRRAGRRSFVNWYQRNYKFMWATARFVKD
ncbi:hypothetical protein EX30DRAFT_55931 [Ascodesmis nigricans]|uniref:Secreted protein n=1 Tax=Ascodesmis nigricans TaxID=341454 RepID=A0A4S2MUP2_9PEZI|nr:hypothetical protein EX30DRAFT_55931 [Ascodesmis nigricans]